MVIKERKGPRHKEPGLSEQVAVGRIIAPTGVKGRVKVQILTDFPERFSSNQRVFLRREPLVIEDARLYKAFAILKFKGLDRVEDVEGLKGLLLTIPEAEVRPTTEGQYYQFQILGLEVWTETGERWGKVTEILTLPGNDVYVVQGSRGEVLIPAVEDIVRCVDIKNHRIIIRPMEGLGF